MGNEPGEGLRELSQVLWRQREALELVLFKLEEQRLLLVNGQSRWLSHASRELEMVLDQVCELELSRAVASASAAAQLNVLDDTRLHALAQAAPAPWPSVIGRHVTALRRLAGEVLALAASNREALLDGLAGTRRIMASGARRPSTRMLLDGAAYHAALATNERVLHPSLVDAVAR